MNNEKSDLKDALSNEKIQALFAFIDFLHENKNQYINTYLPIVYELQELNTQRNLLNPDKNYKERLEYDKVQKRIEDKFAPLYSNVTLPILEQLKSLGIWAGEKTYTSIYNSNIGPILNLTKNFNDEDVEVIKSFKKKYVDFRAETNSYFLSLQFAFEGLDEIFKILFDYFKDTDVNGFESFEQRTIEVGSAAKAIKLFKEGKKQKYKIVLKPSIQNSENTSLNLGLDNDISIPTKEIEKTNKDFSLERMLPESALQEILARLKVQGFCYMENGQFFWSPDLANGNDTQKKWLVALGESLRAVFVKEFRDKEIYQALSEFFNLTLSKQNYSTAKKSTNFDSLKEYLLDKIITKKVK